MYQRIEWILLTKVHHSIGVTNKGQRGQSREGVVPGRSRRDGRKIAHQNVLTKEHKSQYDSLISKPKVTTSRTNFCYF